MKNFGPKRESVPVDYRWWQNQAKDLISPLIKLMEKGKASMPIEGMASDHDENADRLESFARPLLLWAHWQKSLEAYSDSNDDAMTATAKEWFREGLLAGTDPESPEFWGHSANFHQHSVEMGLMVIGLELSREHLWSTLTDPEKQQVLLWLESDVGNGHHWNNHMFFGILVMEFLIGEGRGHEAYRLVIDRWFEELDGMYASEGWYMDGMNQAFDFYNAYAWHYYVLWWISLYGENDKERCRRWGERCGRFLEDYPRFFAESGEHPAFGRSITYRFNATAPIGLAHALGVSPLEPGLSRSLCQRNLKFFTDKPIAQSQGCLSLGWYDEFIDMVEVYSCGGSTYWAAKAFAPLLLGPDDAFWSDEEVTCPASKGDSALALKPPSLVVRNTNGEVEIVNVGSQIASTNTRFGPYKWGLLSYKSSYGFTIVRDGNLYPLDSGLTAQAPEGNVIYGRHYTAPAIVESDRMACLYSLGRKFEQFQVSVETRMWWQGDWQLIVHRCIAKQDSILRHGSYALSSGDATQLETGHGGLAGEIWNGEHGVALQGVFGFENTEVDSRLSDADGPRRHIQAPFHATLLLKKTMKAAEETYLVCLSWSGKVRAEGAPWKVDRLAAGEWRFSHDSLGEWCVEDKFLPKLD
ncbi:MAG: DUF2264 domain-containing protein [Verrucomicrobiaceae bacterium]